MSGPRASQRRSVRAAWPRLYLADAIKHERKVALKVLKPELAAVVGAERFLAEIIFTRKAPQGHKTLQDNPFPPLGRVESNHQPPG